MSTYSSSHIPLVTAIRWVARGGGLLFVVAMAITDAIIIAETVGGHGPNWATLSASQWAAIVLTFGLPLITLAGIVTAWLRTGVGEGIGGTVILVAAVAAMVSGLVGPDSGGLSMALSSLPMALVGVGFLYCWWDTRHAHPQQAA